MIAMAASSFPPEPISGKIIHVISPHYIRFQNLITLHTLYKVSCQGLLITNINLQKAVICYDCIHLFYSHFVIVYELLYFQ